MEICRGLTVKEAGKVSQVFAGGLVCGCIRLRLSGIFGLAGHFIFALHDSYYSICERILTQAVLAWKEVHLQDQGHHHCQRAQ